jgi:hypothetical protein
MLIGVPGYWELQRVLPRERRIEVLKLAYLGRRAPDPETAWFVAERARNGPLGPLWWDLSFSVFFLLVFIVIFISEIVADGWRWSLLWLMPIVALWVLLLLGDLGRRRAVLLNAPIARAPDMDESPAG